MSGVSIGDGRWYERCEVCGEFEDVACMRLASHPEPAKRKPSRFFRTQFDKLLMCPTCDGRRWKTTVKFGVCA